MPPGDAGERALFHLLNLAREQKGHVLLTSRDPPQVRLPDLQSRLDDLRSRANEGALTDDERDEYERFVEALDLLALLKTRARAALRRQSA